MALMEKSSRLGMANNHHQYPADEDKEMTKAALFLSYLKHVVLDSKTARDLENTKNKFLGRSGLYPNSGTKRKALQIQGLEAPQAQKAINAAKEDQGLPGQQQLQVQGLFFGDYVPPELPPVPNLQNVIEICSKPFEKQLTDSDVRKDQARLSMRKDVVEKHIIPLLNDDEDPNQGIPVTVYDIAGQGYPMIFKTWVSKIHVLTSGWRSFCHDHGLRMKQDFVTLWVFRNSETGNLCFVINSRRFPVFQTVKRSRTMQN